MKKDVYVLGIVFVVVLSVSCVSNLESATSPSFHGKDIDKIAVIISYHHSLPQRMVEDQFIRELVRKGYQVPARSDIDTILAELQLQFSDITDEDASKIGKMLNVQAILVVTLTLYEEMGGDRKIAFGARLIGIEKSDVLWIGSINAYTTWDLYNGTIQTMSTRLARSIPERSK